MRKQPGATATIPVEFLQSVRLFSNLSQTEIEQIRPYLSPREFRRGEVVFLKGDPCQALYIIRSGHVKLSEMSESGREQGLFVLNPGDFFDLAVCRRGSFGSS